MANQRGTFLKRQREQNLKDKARAKEERLAARRARAENRTEKGPPIATIEELNASNGIDSPDLVVPPAPIKPPTP
jgi:hypothetical protein